MPATIHPSSIIDPQAQLADDVVVGPNCVIGANVTIGPGTRLIASVHLEGPLTLGSGNTLYPFVCLGLAPQDRKFDPGHPGAGLVIGDRNIFRESANIHRATGDAPTRIGSDNYFMATSHVGHDGVVGNHCTIANSVLLAGHVHVADQVTFGGNAVMHQFCRIGRLAIVSGMTGLLQDVPPFAMVHRTNTVGGINLVGLRRAGLRQHIRPLQQAMKILYLRRLPNRRAAEMIESELGNDPLCLELAHFVRDTKRGLVHYAAH